MIQILKNDFIYTQLQQFINKYLHKRMIDVLIIIAYLILAIKVLLSVFSWVQNKFEIYGTKPQSPPDAQNENFQTDNEKFTNNQQLILENLNNQSQKLKSQIPLNQIKIQEDEQNILQIKITEESQKKRELVLELENLQNTLEQLKIEQILQPKQQNQQIKTQSNKMKENKFRQFSLTDQKKIKKQCNKLLKEIEEIKIQRYLAAQKFQGFLKEKQTLQKSKWQLAQQFMKSKENYEKIIVQMKQQHQKELQGQRSIVSTAYSNVEKLSDERSIQ